MTNQEVFEALQTQIETFRNQYPKVADAIDLCYGSLEAYEHALEPQILPRIIISNSTERYLDAKLDQD